MGYLIPMEGEEWTSKDDETDVIRIESYDFAYAVAFSLKLNQQILVAASHFGPTYTRTKLGTHEG